MKKLILCILACAALHAQSFPASIYTRLVAKDNVQTTLNQAMAIGDTTAFVASTTGWAANMVAYICDTSTATRCTGTFEVMLVTAVPSANALTVTRAYGGTSAVAHASGKGVLNAPTAVYNTTLSNEVWAIETALGPNLSSLAQVFTASNNYNFSVQTPGGSLASGNTTITMAPVPAGVNGTDTDHYLYVSGGTGTAEPCLIAGGSGTAGQTSGLITINCVNTHTGAWTIRSATSGISEAIWGMTSGIGGRIVTPAGTLPIYAPIKRRLLTPIWVEGQGMQATTLAVQASFPLTGVNGVFDWSPGDTNAVPVGGASELTIQFIQPDSAAGCPGACNVSAIYTHWKPAIYSAGTYHSEWRNIAIIAGWDGITVPTNTNGLLLHNIYGSCFRRLTDLDNLFDSVILDNVHSSTTGLTANQGTAFLNSASPISFYLGRVDDVKISNSTSGTTLCADFHSGSGGDGPIGFASNFWCEGNVTMSNGLMQFSGFHSAGSGAVPLISQTGGQLFLDNATMLYTGSATAIAALITGNSATAGGVYPAQFSLTNSRLDTQTVDHIGAFCSTAAPYVDKFDCILGNNYFYRTPGTAFTTASVEALAGTGDTRLTATGNRISQVSGGTGTAFLLDTNTTHVITGNDCGGYAFTLPAAVTNMQWFGNNNCASNVHYLHDAVEIAARTSATSFTSNKTENYIGTESGANNAITGALLDAAGVAVPLSAGVKVSILLAHSLQAGANTFAMNGGATKSIKRSTNPATDLGTAYVSGSLVTMTYDGTVWQVVGQ